MTTKILQQRVGIFFGSAIVSCILFSCSSTNKAAKLNAGDIKEMVNSSQFVFVADRMSPMRGGTKNLTSRYTVKVMKNNLNSNLPYVGRATQAPANMTGGGIKFITSKFSYDVVSKKEGQWYIIAKPGDDLGDLLVQQLSFTIFSNGSANLNVTSTNRDPISFSGHLEKLKTK